MENLSDHIHILVVEDNPADFLLLEEMLLSSRLKAARVQWAERLSQALDVLQREEIHVVLLDLSLPDSFGIDSFLQIREYTNKIPVIILTGVNDDSLALEAINKDAQDYLVKGEFNSHLLLRSIEYSIERKKAKEKLHASEEKYRQIFYKNPFPMLICDRETLEIFEVNEAAIQQYGYNRNEFLLLTILHLFHGSVPSRKEIFSKATWNHQTREGKELIVEATHYPIEFFDKTAVQFQLHDVTEERRLQRELSLQKQQQMKTIMDAQERERKNMGEELHDNINQILTAVKLNLEMALLDKEKREALVLKCLNNTSLIIEEIRKLSKSYILSGNIKELGLAHSITELTKEYYLLKNIQFHLNTREFREETLNQEEKLAIYRIVQEQVNNVLKHAQASDVYIDLTSGMVFTLQIRDNGKGFNMREKPKGVGLTNIFNRAELLNGKISIDSAPGEGCLLRFVFKPLKDAVQAPGKEILNPSLQ